MAAQTRRRGGRPTAELRSRETTLTNGAEIFTIPMAEWVLSAMLSAVKRNREVDAAQRQHRDLEGDELYGRTLLVVGGGGIGQPIIDRAAAFGMRIWSTNRVGAR